MAPAKQQITTVPIYSDGKGPLAEQFVGVVTSAETVSPDAQPYLEVVAPATLPEVSIT
jgi:hypothetical protein